MYDYEIQTASLYNDSIQTKFENDMLYNLANRYELIDCNNATNNQSGSTSRRYYHLRRSLQQQQQQEDEDSASSNISGGVIALDGNPIDESMIDSCKLLYSFILHVKKN